KPGSECLPIARALAIAAAVTSGTAQALPGVGAARTQAGHGLCQIFDRRQWERRICLARALVGGGRTRPGSGGDRPTRLARSRVAARCQPDNHGAGALQPEVRTADERLTFFCRMSDTPGPALHVADAFRCNLSARP